MRGSVEERLRQELAEALEFNRQLLASSTDCIKMLDLDARLLFVSEGGLRVLEACDASDLVGADWLSFWKGEDHAAALAAVVRARAGGHGHFRAFCRTVAGTPKWWDVVVSPIRNAGGEIEKLLAVSRDVTEQVRSEEEVRRAREHLQFVTDAAATSIAHCSAERRFLFVNRAYAERFGLTPDEVAGKTVAEVLGERAYESIRPYIERALAGEELQYEVEIHYSRIGRRYMHCAYTPEVGPDGRVIGWVAVVTDMTERRQLEQDLAERETMLRLAQRAGGVGTFDWDLVTQIAKCSSAYFEMFGLDSGDGTMSTEEWQRYTHPDDRERVIRHLIDTLENKGSGSADYRVVRPDGEVRWVHYAGQVLLDAEGKPARMIGTVLDVTDRKRFEESLREADRRKDEFLATLAHELRNPLAPIRNAVQVLQLKAPPDPGVRWARDVIDRQTQQLCRLVDDLLDVSRITRGKVELRRERVELSAIAERALETSRPVLEAAHHRLTVTFPEEPLCLMADVTRMAQVLSNLLNNAAKYTRPGGHIQLSARRDGDRALVEVRDDGIGIPPEMLANIFGLFTQVDTSLERAQGGLGIGLTIARNLVEMHGGTIEAASDGLGKGSAFAVRLPLAPEEGAVIETRR